jgi:hypothetical protein
MLNELSQIDEYNEPIAQSVLVHLYRHIGQLAQHLEEGGWLSREKDLNHGLQEAVELLESVVNRGDLHEFRR